MNKILKLIGREQQLFTNDIKILSKDLEKTVSDSNFLVIGGAGSIGQAVVKEIFKRNPKKLLISLTNSVRLFSLISIT